METNTYDGFGGGWLWVFFLFFLLAWGGNGLGFGNSTAAAQGALTRADLADGFNNNMVGNKLDNITLGISNGVASLNSAIADSRFAQQQCCCETNRNIDSVRAEAYKNTCEIVNAVNTQGQLTRDLIEQNTIQALRDKIAEKDQQLQTATFALSQEAQNNTLISALKPVPLPAYLTCSPYQSNYYATNGFGCNGCGCS